MKKLMLVAAIVASLPAPALARLDPSADRLLARYQPGPEQDCLPNFLRNRESQFFADNTVAFRGESSNWYLTRLPACPKFRSQMSLVTSDPTSQLCRGDIVRLVEPVSGTFLGSCPLGGFTPYTKPRGSR